MATQSNPLVSLEQLGLYYMLERVLNGNASMQDMVRIGLRTEGFIDASDPPTLTDRGRHTLQTLRQLVDASNDSTVS